MSLIAWMRLDEMDGWMMSIRDGSNEAEENKWMSTWMRLDGWMKLDEMDQRVKE